MLSFMLIPKWYFQNVAFVASLSCRYTGGVRMGDEGHAPVVFFSSHEYLGLGSSNNSKLLYKFLLDAPAFIYISLILFFSKSSPQKK